MSAITAKLGRLATEATPGPWTLEIHQHFDGELQGYEVTDTTGFDILYYDAGNRDFDRANAAYIAAASPDVVLSLLDDNAALSERVGALEAALEGLCVVMEHCSVTDGMCCCGESMDSHSLMSGHSPTDHGSYASERAYQVARALLSHPEKDETP